jgi:DNA-binding response OmpR family regulator
VTAERRPLVLVADDDPDILSLVKLRLERSGYDVVSAGDGEQALETARTQSPDLALLDVMMPKLDGYEVTARLRQEEATRHLPVILLTARVQESDIARGVEAGADDYVKKPFSTHELRDRVQAVLGR